MTEFKKKNKIIKTITFGKWEELKPITNKIHRNGNFFGTSMQWELM